MRHTILLPLAVASLLSLMIGCSDASSGPPDPTSEQALHKTKTMSYGTTCLKVDHSSYGGSHSNDETPQCLDNSNRPAMDDVTL